MAASLFVQVSVPVAVAVPVWCTRVRVADACPCVLPLWVCVARMVLPVRLVFSPLFVRVAFESIVARLLSTGNRRGTKAHKREADTGPSKTKTQKDQNNDRRY